MDEQQILDKVHALSLDAYREFDRVCKKHGIECMFSYGALLGAIRHSGFVPWDNDIDLWITRDNYEKLLKVKDEFSSDYIFVLPDSLGDDVYLDCTPRLNYKRMYIKLSPELCKYYSNKNNRLDLDLFILDRTYDGVRGTLQRLELKLIYGLMNARRHKGISQGYPLFYRIAGVPMNIVGRIFKLSWLRKRQEQVATKYQNRADATMFFPSNDGFYMIKNIAFKEEELFPLKYLPFEDIEAPVPNDASCVLEALYGDYMTLPPEEERVPHWGRDNFDVEAFVFEEPGEWWDE